MGASRACATRRSPPSFRQARRWSFPGCDEPARFPRKQLPVLAVAESARSAAPLPRTTFPVSQFPYGRQGRPELGGGHRARRRRDRMLRAEDGDPVAAAAGDGVVANAIRVPAGDADPDPVEPGERRVQRHASAAGPRNGVPDDQRPRLWRILLVRVGVREDPGAVPVPERVADDERAARVRARVADGREPGDEVPERRATRVALADVVGRVRRAGNVVVLDDAVGRVLGVDPVAEHVPDGEVRAGEPGDAVPVEAVLQEVVR